MHANDIIHDALRLLYRNYKNDYHDLGTIYLSVEQVEWLHSIAIQYKLIRDVLYIQFVPDGASCVNAPTPTTLQFQKGADSCSKIKAN